MRKHTNRLILSYYNFVSPAKPVNGTSQYSTLEDELNFIDRYEPFLKILFPFENSGQRFFSNLIPLIIGSLINVEIIKYFLKSCFEFAELIMNTVIVAYTF
jgi:hypothetical protein